MHDVLTFVLDHWRSIWLVGSAAIAFCWLAAMGATRVPDDDLFPCILAGLLVAGAFPIVAIAALAAIAIFIPYGIGWLVTYPYHEKKRRLATVTDYMATGKRADA
jgi:hypothetical protein